MVLYWGPFSPISMSESGDILTAWREGCCRHLVGGYSTLPRTDFGNRLILEVGILRSLSCVLWLRP